MKAKTIKSVLRNKHKCWLGSIKDDAVRALAADGTIITGGCIASMLLRERVNDYDIYFRNRETVVAVAGYYVEQFKLNPPAKYKDDPNRHVDIYLANGYGHKLEGTPDPNDERANRVKVVVKSAGVAGEKGSDDYQYFETITDPNSLDAAEFVEKALEIADASKSKGKPEFRPVFLTSNAITLSDDIQLVLRFYGEAEQIHSNYDFVHCTNYWKSWDGELVLHAAALESLLSKELRYVGSKYPLCSVIRTRKFIQRQWTINAGQYLKMAMQLNDLDLNDVNVLEEQLTGVDAAYFNQVIKELRERNSDSVDRAYLCELIDKLF